MKFLPYETVLEIIAKTGFGTYKLFTLPGNNLVAGSHLMADPETDAKMTSDNLVIHLREAVDLIGDGQYRIILKKSNKSQTNTEVAYHFTASSDKSDNGGSVVAPIQFAGLSGDKIETIVSERVAQLMAAKEAEWESKRQVERLEREIAELKKRKPTRKKQSDLQGLVNLGLVFGSAFVTEQWPNTKPMVEKALGAISAMSDEGDDEDEDDEDDSTFTRPQ